MPFQGKYQELFNQEIKILEIAKGNLEKFDGENPLHPHYKMLLQNYEKLLKDMKKISLISDIQGKALKKKESELKSLLDNANQGFLTFGEDLLIHKQYSAECLELFGKKISNVNIVELLWGDNPANVKKYSNWLRMAFKFENEFEQYNYFDEFPKYVPIGNRTIQLEWKWIQLVVNEVEETVIMLILTDVTEKLMSEERVKYLSYHDCLTSLYNRTYIDKVLPRIINLENLPISIILLDMNGLKFTNDVFGHLQGDEFLKKAARILLESARNNDIVARWGGDEFLMILPRTNEETCKQLTEYIKKKCKMEKKSPIEMSAAIGTATLHQEDEDIYELFVIAEKRMYKNKILESKLVRQTIINDLEEIKKAKDPVGFKHAKRLQRTAERFAKIVGLKDYSSELKNLKMVAMFHDIGHIVATKEHSKIAEKVSTTSIEVLQTNSEVGYRLARTLGELAVAEAILGFHEKWDGTGFPNSLKGEQIPFLSRLLAILDAFDMMTHYLNDGQTGKVNEALNKIKQQSGKQFDPMLVQLFLDHVAEIVDPQS